MEWMKKIKEAIIDFGYHFEWSGTSLKLDRKQNELLQQQALKRKGILRSGITTSLVFPYHEMNVSVSYRLRDLYPPVPEKTAVKVKLCLTTDSRLEIYRHGDIFVELVKAQKYKMHNIQTGNPSFDNKFVVKGNEESFVLNILKSEIQSKLLEIDYYYPVVELTKNKFIFTIQSLIFEDEEYDKVIDTALILLDRLRGLACIEYDTRLDKD